MGSRHFDFEGFYSALDGIRRVQGLTWRQVSRAAEVSPSSLSRMAQGSKPDLDTIASLADWASLDAASFFPKKDSGNPLSMASAYFHRDPALTPEAAVALEQLLRATYSQLAQPQRKERRSKRS